MEEVGYKSHFLPPQNALFGHPKHSKIGETDEMAYITTYAGWELSKLDRFNKNKQMTIMGHHFAAKNLCIIFLSGATFGELDHGAAVLKLKWMLWERLASLDFQRDDGFWCPFAETELLFTCYIPVKPFWGGKSGHANCVPWLSRYRCIKLFFKGPRWIKHIDVCPNLCIQWHECNFVCQSMWWWRSRVSVWNLAPSVYGRYHTLFSKLSLVKSQETTTNHCETK